MDIERVLIFGNSGAGKSTLAKRFAADFDLAHLDLDILAWKNSTTPERMPLSESAKKIDAFVSSHERWAAEGCYSDLLRLLILQATDVIFLNPGTEVCVSNCKNRPWEPHKYATPAEQERNLDMLIDWVRQYAVRCDEFSLTAHQELFKVFTGRKSVYRSNADPSLHISSFCEYDQ